MGRLDGKVALVSGGARGMGRAHCRLLAAEGARVAVCDVDAGAVADFAGAHPEAIAEVADVTDEAEMGAFLARVEDAFGGADVVCANAGIGGPAGAIEDLDYAEWRACLDVNLAGAFLTCRWAARVMRAQGSGLIVLTSSTAGLYGYPMRSPYAAAKWGVIGLMKTLAMELGPAGVRVNAICPGAVEGPRMDRVIAAEAKARGLSEAETRALYVRGVSLRRWVTAGEVADMVAFLASPQAAKISGQALAIDGHTETLAP